MGAFFTNVQVYTGGRPHAAIREGIIGAVRAQAAAAGQAEDPSLEDVGDEDDGGRIVLIAPAGSEPWITVYDSATESQADEPLHDLGERLSRIGGAAVTVLVHDSDILQLRLYRGGAEADHYNSVPDYFEDVTDDERAAVAGQADRWAGLLAEGATPDALQAAWTTDVVFAEDLLRDVAALLGWDEERCSVGYRYLMEDEPDLDGFTRLAFR